MAYGGPVHSSTIEDVTTGVSDLNGPCLSLSGKTKNGVHASVLEIRVSDAAGVESACNTCLGETAAANDYGHKTA